MKIETVEIFPFRRILLFLSLSLSLSLSPALAHTAPRRPFAPAALQLVGRLQGGI